MKEGSMPDEQLKMVLENSVSSVMRITYIICILH